MVKLSWKLAKKIILNKNSKIFEEKWHVFSWLLWPWLPPPSLWVANLQQIPIQNDTLFGAISSLQWNNQSRPISSPNIRLTCLLYVFPCSMFLFLSRLFCNIYESILFRDGIIYTFLILISAFKISPYFTISYPSFLAICRTSHFQNQPINKDFTRIFVNKHKMNICSTIFSLLLAIRLWKCKPWRMSDKSAYKIFIYGPILKMSSFTESF